MNKKQIYLQKLKFYITVMGMSTTFAASAGTKAYALDNTWKNTAKRSFEALVDWSADVDSYINEKAVDPLKDYLLEKEIYKKESLWIITDMPSKDPKEERNYYFIDKNTPSFRWTFYYDGDGNKVSKKANNITKMEIREMYVSLTNPDVVFKIEQWFDYQKHTFTVNYEDFDSTMIYNPEATVKYGRFQNIDDILPLEYLKEKYSTKELQDILDIINKLDFEIKEQASFPLERK